MLDYIYELLVSFNDVFKKLLILVILFFGIYFTIKMKFIQFTHFKHAFKVLNMKKEGSEVGLSSFQVLCTSMAARVGTGNIAGVAVAISYGGPGAVFWMWVTALIGMATALIEATLAQVYKRKDLDGQFIGGPSYYMQHGLNKRWMGLLFSVLLIISYGLAFNLVQANTIGVALTHTFSIGSTPIAISLSILVALVIFGGIRSVANIASTIVPFMALLYMFMSFYVVITNIEDFPAVIWSILHEALNFHQMIVGGSAAVIFNGVVRGLFSNEAGMGSSANIAASADPNPDHPASQGFVQMLGVFFDTIVICTASAALIMLTDMHNHAGDGGIDLILSAVGKELGAWSSVLLTLILFLFCFTSIVANYTYAESNIAFIFDGNKLIINFFKLVLFLMVAVGVYSKMPVVWKIADISALLMSSVNLAALWMLSSVSLDVVNDYIKQKDKNKIPVFNVESIPSINDPNSEWSAGKHSNKIQSFDT